MACRLDRQTGAGNIGAVCHFVEAINMRPPSHTVRCAAATEPVERRRDAPGGRRRSVNGHCALDAPFFSVLEMPHSGEPPRLRGQGRNRPTNARVSGRARRSSVDDHEDIRRGAALEAQNKCCPTRLTLQRRESSMTLQSCRSGSRTTKEHHGYEEILPARGSLCGAAHRR